MLNLGNVNAIGNITRKGSINDIGIDSESNYIQM